MRKQFGVSFEAVTGVAQKSLADGRSDECRQFTRQTPARALYDPLDGVGPAFCMRVADDFVVESAVEFTRGKRLGDDFRAYARDIAERDADPETRGH
jgi:hypothetical protein